MDKGKVSKINEDYFGTDKSKNYLKDDYFSVLRGAIVRSILIELYRELDKTRHNKQDLPGGGTAYGDFDPDNAGFFANIFSVYQKGWMIEVRILLGGLKNKNRGGREAGTGGRFIDEVAELSTDDFIKYYIESDGIIIPRCLSSKFREGGPHNRASFIKDNSDVINELVLSLTNKAKKFQSQGYYHKIIKDYEAIEFHKDNRPDKYSIHKEPIDVPFSNGHIIIRRPRAGVEIHFIAQCLNEFAEIISIYQRLVGENTSFVKDVWPLDVFILRTLNLFAKALPNNTAEKLGKDMVKHLRPALAIVGWDHQNSTSPKLR